MKTYTSIREAVSDLKARTGHGYVSYFVNGTQVGAADYRMAEGEETIYRSGLEIRAEKHDTEGGGTAAEYSAGASSSKCTGWIY